MASKSPTEKLDLTSLHSYSPHWPHALRLTLAIAVQYACQRCVDRAEAVHKLLYPGELAGETIRSVRTAAVERSSQRDGAESMDKSVQAAAELVQRDEDGNVQGELQGWARTQQMQQDREIVEAWREYAQKYLTATCQHLGIVPDALPPGPMTLEDIRAAGRGRARGGEVAEETEYEMGTCHAPTWNEGTGKHGKEIRDKEEEMEEEKEKEAAEYGDEEKGGVNVSAIRSHTAALQEAESNPIARTGGVMDDGSSREIEVVNELLLVALGMGQHRAEDGCTTLFEQDAIFGDTEVTSDAAVTAHQRDDEAGAVESPTIAESSSAAAAAAVSKTGARVWGALVSGVDSIGKAGKAAADKAAARRANKEPVKPNELCHYDARARAIIFVAVTAMDASGMDVHMAEKVVAQTIYFIMSDGRTASQKVGKGDPLRDGDNEEDKSGRGRWMNTASHEAVERDKNKTNWAKWAAMGAGAAVGGALIGVTGGLAAPLVAPALVSLTGISFLATTGGVVMMATLLGVSGAGLAGYRVQRRLRGIDRFEFHQVQSVARQAGVIIPSLHATICCSGLQLNDDRQGQAFDYVFHQTSDARDAYTVHAEEDTMKQAGEALRGYVLDTALRSGGQRVGTEVLKHTALAGIAALTLPLTAWTAASAALDGAFVRAKSRAYRAGLILADVLRDEVQGHRPVTLIGSSLGCVTILTALGELAKTSVDGDAGRIVDSVYLIGAPFSPSPATLRRARSVVARRFVTAHSSRDMVCAVAAWLGSGISLEEVRQGAMPRIVGAKPVLGVPGVESVDVSDLVNSHFVLNDGETLKQVLKRCRAVQE